MSRTRSAVLRAACVAALCFLAAAAAGWPAGKSADPPLTNEAVVRLVMARTPEAEILEQIARAPLVDFDLDEEVLAEMRAVGVTEAIIAAMKKRVPGGGAPARPSRPEEARGRLELSFPTTTDLEIWRQSIAGPGRTPDGKPLVIALYAICTDPTHVPDLWETKTPLAGTIPRHEKLWFQEGSAPVNAQRKNSPVYVPLPGPVTLDVTAGSHPIEFGAVVRLEAEPWIPLVSAASRVEVPANGVARVEIRLKTLGSAQTFPRPGAKSPYSVEIIIR